MQKVCKKKKKRDTSEEIEATPMEFLFVSFLM